MGRMLKPKKKEKKKEVIKEVKEEIVNNVSISGTALDIHKMIQRYNEFVKAVTEKNKPKVKEFKEYVNSLSTFDYNNKEMSPGCCTNLWDEGDW